MYFYYTQNRTKVVHSIKRICLVGHPEQVLALTHPSTSHPKTTSATDDQQLASTTPTIDPWVRFRESRAAMPPTRQGLYPIEGVFQQHEDRTKGTLYEALAQAKGGEINSDVIKAELPAFLNSYHVTPDAQGWLKENSYLPPGMATIQERERRDVVLDRYCAYLKDTAAAGCVLDLLVASRKYTKTISVLSDCFLDGYYLTVQEITGPDTQSPEWENRWFLLFDGVGYQALTPIPSITIDPQGLSLPSLREV